MIPTTTEVKSARHRLDGVLQTIVTRRQGSSPRGVDSDDDSAGGSGGLGVGSCEDAKDKKPPRKKRRKDDYDDGGSYHHTYVMKLFDRSVDLAQFHESTPLYPIARAWIHNQPHGKTNKYATGAPDVDAFDEKAGGGGRGKGVEEVVGDVEIAQGCSSDIYRLPPPTEAESEAGKNSRVPETLPWPKEEFYVHSRSIKLEENTTVPPSQDLLLMNHLSRWRTIRRQWKQQCTINESRYSESMNLIKKMFEDSQASVG